MLKHLEKLTDTITLIGTDKKKRKKRKPKSKEENTTFYFTNVDFMKTNHTPKWIIKNHHTSIVQQNQTKSLMRTKPVQHINRMHFTFRAGCKVEIYFLSMRKHQQ